MQYGRRHGGDALPASGDGSDGRTPDVEEIGLLPEELFWLLHGRPQDCPQA